MDNVQMAKDISMEGLGRRIKQGCPCGLFSDVRVTVMNATTQFTIETMCASCSSTAVITLSPMALRILKAELCTPPE